MSPKLPKVPPSIYTSTYGSEEGSSRLVALKLILQGDPPERGDWLFLAVYNGQIVLDGKWVSGTELVTEALPLNLREPYYQELVTDIPLVYLLRTISGKGAKELDPLLNVDNRYGATVDLFPLIRGQEEVFVKVPLVNIVTGQPTKSMVATKAFTSEPPKEEITTVPLIMTMISAHCLPSVTVKEGTVLIGAIGLDKVIDPIEVNFGMSLSCKEAEKVVWASVSNAGYGANSAISVSNEDNFIPEDLVVNGSNECQSFYWNAMKRVCVDRDLLRERLKSPFVFELAGVPRFGKIDVRGRYMAFVNAGVLLEPGQFRATVCSKLLFYNETELPENVGALLELPPSSAKVSARETDTVVDEFAHRAYIVIKFDLCDPIIPKAKIATLYESIGLIAPEAPAGPIDSLDLDPPPEDPSIDVRKIRRESGALAVHKELGSLACRGAVPMNQSIKKTAANRLLMRVRSMLKQFKPGDCSYSELQDTVTRQHAASRRAVTSSFAPQTPPARQPAPIAATRCRMAGDDRIADKHIKTNIQLNSRNPRSLICKALRCLDEGNDLDAENYILDGLDSQPKCRYLLWLYGGQEFNKGIEATVMAATAFRIAVKADYSDGTANAIGWAAIHALWHYRGNQCAAFVALRKMRKYYELPTEWKKFLQRWIDASGEEELYWIPGVLATDDPILLAAAFFLCLRCYKFSETLLNCVERGCATRGSRHSKSKMYCSTADIYYVRAATLVLRRKLEEALQVTTEAIKLFGPSSIMAQMRATCLILGRSWDVDCRLALEDADKAGAEICPALLLRAAVGIFREDQQEALQYAARAHKIAPCAHSALVFGRIYVKMKEIGLAERWLAVAVKFEPLLADAWAVLGLIAMYEKKLGKARMMLRTARQVGPVSPDIGEEVKKVMKIVQVEDLSGSMVRDLCLCEHY